MSPPASSRPWLRIAVVVALAATLGALALSACGGDDDDESASTQQTHTTAPGASVAAGKRLFTENCGSCHTLGDAGTTGDDGPNLDDEFRDDSHEDRVEETLEAIEEGPEEMPSNLVTGADARNVAEYVASVSK